MEFLRGKKTYIIAGLMMVVSIINMVTGDISIGEVLSDPNLRMLLEGFGLSFLRAGVAKVL